MKFLGDVDEREIHQVCRSATEVAQRHAAFQLECRGLGGFPNETKTKTLWMGLHDPQQDLLNLHRDLDDVLHKLGFPLDRGRFRPHLTLGRFADSAGRGGGYSMPEVFSAAADQTYGSLAVDELVVLASELSRDGPRYVAMGRAPLR